MKKVICLAVSLLIILSMFTGCDPVQEVIRGLGAGETQPTEKEIEQPTEAGRKEMSTVELAELASLATVTVESATGTGSGFFIDDEGTLVTCYHVIDGTDTLSVELSDGGVYSVETIIDFDDAYDIAVLKVDISGNAFLDICEERPRQGESVYAVGSSLGFLDGTFSDGMISATSRVVGGVDYVQTTAPISAGNSGGPLINAYGEVVGVCAATYTSGENTNLAISVDMLDKLAMDKNWKISRYNEWYVKETKRSYQVYSYSEEEFLPSLTNTYHHVTGRECYASDYDWGVLYEYSSTFTSGYHEHYGVYFYKYNVNEFDKYTDYLLENGYEFLEYEEYDVGTSYYYGNEFYGFYMDIFISIDEEYIALEPYCA